MPVIPKAEMLRRVQHLVERLRLSSAYSSGPDVYNLIDLEAALDAIEAEHARTIDNYQDGLYRKHNAKTAEPDIHGLTGHWNWHRRSA